MGKRELHRWGRIRKIALQEDATALGVGKSKKGKGPRRSDCLNREKEGPWRPLSKGETATVASIKDHGFSSQVDPRKWDSMQIHWAILGDKRLGQ